MLPGLPKSQQWHWFGVLISVRADYCWDVTSWFWRTLTPSWYKTFKVERMRTKLFASVGGVGRNNSHSTRGSTSNAAWSTHWVGTHRTCFKSLRQRKWTYPRPWFAPRDRVLLLDRRTIVSWHCGCISSVARCFGPPKEGQGDGCDTDGAPLIDRLWKNWH